jgi:hypothetical protein
MSTPALGHDEAIDRLAERLHFLLEKYDPSDAADWDTLTDHQKEVFRATIRGLLNCRDWVDVNSAT